MRRKEIPQSVDQLEVRRERKDKEVREPQVSRCRMVTVTEVLMGKKRRGREFVGQVIVLVSHSRGIRGQPGARGGGAVKGDLS